MNKIRSRKRAKSESIPRKKNSWIGSAADWLTVKLGLERQLTASMLMKILWIGFLALIYIFFQHNMDKLIRNNEIANRKVDESRADYISNKSRYLYASKQSEIEKRLERIGFDNTESPVKISTTKP